MIFRRPVTKVRGLDAMDIQFPRSGGMAKLARRRRRERRLFHSRLRGLRRASVASVESASELEAKRVSKRLGAVGVARPSRAVSAATLWRVEATIASCVEIFVSLLVTAKVPKSLLRLQKAIVRGIRDDEIADGCGRNR